MEVDFQVMPGEPGCSYVHLTPTCIRDMLELIDFGTNVISHPVADVDVRFNRNEIAVKGVEACITFSRRVKPETTIQRAK